MQGLAWAWLTFLLTSLLMIRVGSVPSFLGRGGLVWRRRLLASCHDTLPAADPHGWTRASRILPPRNPALSVSDWDFSMPRPGRGDVEEGYQYCHEDHKNQIHWPVYRYKLHGGKLWSDRPHYDDHYIPYAEYRQPWVGALVLVLWLYKDFPNLDFVVDFSDYPRACPMRIPFLKYTAFNLSSVDSNPFSKYSVADLFGSSYDSKAAANFTTDDPHMTGFTMPGPQAWSSLSLSRAQLEHLVSCTNQKHPHEKREDKVFWRGSASGRQYLFPADVFNQTPGSRAQQFGFLTNKRTYMAYLAYPFSFLDVGITDMGIFKQEAGDSTKVVMKPALDMEAWNHATVTISIDGWGPPYRLPHQLLGGSALLVQKSPYLMWFQVNDSVWKEGVHYRSFQYDLSDFIARARELVHRPSDELKRMAEKAQESAVRVLNVFAQLDSIAWSLARIKELSDWEVRPPTKETEAIWRPVKLKRGGDWSGSKGVPHHVRAAIEKDLPELFL